MIMVNVGKNPSPMDPMGFNHGREKVSDPELVFFLSQQPPAPSVVQLENLGRGSLWLVAPGHRNKTYTPEN